MIKNILRLVKKKFTKQPRSVPVKTSATKVTEKTSGSPQNVATEPGYGPANINQPTSKQKYRRPSRKRKKQKKTWNPESFNVVPAPDKKRFHDLELPNEIMHAIADLEYRYCTPIQEKSLPTTLKGLDIVAKANTGTGKSAVFLITILSRLVKEGRSARSVPGSPRALVIAPTRELVIQIAKDGRKLAKYTRLNFLAVYGGEGYQKQQDLARDKKNDVMVATPGRLLDFVGKKIIRLDQCEYMVIDEADRMLDMGFIPDVRRIIRGIKEKGSRQTMMFSATITEDVKQLAYQWCRKPEVVNIPTEKLTVDTVGQIVYLVTTEEKFTVLCNLIMSKPDDRIIIFTNQKHEAKNLSKNLKNQNIRCSLLSGDIPQNKRGKRLEDFRKGKIRVLVATDVAARGIHIEGISHVVNFNLPYEPENYVHRIGRTGRAGALGTSISFACEEGAFYLPEIEEYIGRKLDCVQPEEELLQPLPEN